MRRYGNTAIVRCVQRSRATWRGEPGGRRALPRKRLSALPRKRAHLVVDQLFYG